MWGTAAFYVFCMSTIFMVFFSTSAIQVWPRPWNQLSILTACFLPVILVLVWKLPEWISARQFKKELLFVPLISILGMLNIVFSENRAVTLKVMAIFLLTGIFVFGITNVLMTTKQRQQIFLYLSWVCLVAFCIYGTIEYINQKSIFLLSFNPIPAGSLLILLFAGPFLLFHTASNRLRILLFASVVAGIAVIIIIGKQGPVLGLLGMVFFGVMMMPKKKLVWIILIIALIMTGIGYKMRKHLPSTLTRVLSGSTSLLYRMENYPLAAHIIQKKPVFGIGLHSPLISYLNDYKPKIVNDENYIEYVKQTKTFENIILCGFVEMGTLFTLSYLALIIYLLSKLFFHIKHNPEKKMHAVLLLSPLFGFLVHSMTFDSLIYPHLNWLFHSYLGIMANFEVYANKSINA